jgi:DNA primase catalytic core
MLDGKKALTIVRDAISLPEFIKHIDIMELHGSGDTYKGLCPFHNETTPSFTISMFEGVWRYYCFGCHKKGDIVSFVRDVYLLDYIDAIQYIADLCEIDLSSAEREFTHEEKEINRKNRIMLKVAEWLWERLIGDRDKAYYYVRDDRGISDDVIDAFKVGYSPNPSELLNFIRGENVGSIADMEFDYPMLWTDSITFPVFSTNGNINRFYTRPFQPNRNHGRYMSTSSKHPLYDKYDSIFGFYQCKKSKVKHKDGIIAVEGHFDCLSAYSNGYDNCIALAGSKLEQSVIDMLNKYSIPKLNVIFDGDMPGRDAARDLSSSELRIGPIDIRTTYVPYTDMDPNQLFRSMPKESFNNIVNETKSLPIYYVDTIANEMAGINSRTNTITDIMSSDIAISFMKKISHYVLNNKNVETRIIIRRIAEWTGLKDEDVMDCMYLYSTHNTFTNTPAELSILRQIIEDGNGTVLPEVSLQLSPDDFSVNMNRHIFSMILHRYTINKIISYDWIISDGVAHGINNIEIYIDTHIKTARIMEMNWCIEDISDKARRRRTVSVSNDIISKITDMSIPVVRIIEELSGRVSTLIYSDNHKAKDRDSMINDAEELHEYRKSKDTYLFGYPMSEYFPRGNDLIGGFEKGKALMLSAPTGVGKTNMCLNWTVGWCMSPLEGFENAKLLYLPLEMDPRQLRFRLWAIHSGIGARKIERGFKLTNEEQYRLELTKQIDRKYGPLIVKPREPTVSAILHEINYWKAKAGVDIVIVDFIQRLSGCELTGTRSDRTNIYELGSKILADRAQVREDIGIVVVSQTSDEAKKAGIAAEGGQAWAKHMPDYYDYTILLLRKDAQQIKQYGAQYGNRWIKYDKNRFGSDLVVVHAHIFNHEIWNDDGTNGEFGSLRIGEIQGLKECNLIDSIRIQDGNTQ